MQIHRNYVFGNLCVWNQLIDGSQDLQGNMRPDSEVQTHAGDERISTLLKARPLLDGSQGGGLFRSTQG